MLNHFAHTVIDSHPLILNICASFLCSCWCHIVSNWFSLHAAGTWFSSLHECYTWKLTCSINAWYFSHVKGSQSRWNALTLQYCLRWGSGEWCHLYCAFQCSSITWCQQHRSAYSIKIVGDLPLPPLHQYRSWHSSKLL